MNILIVDDEALARDRLARMLSEIDDVQVVGQASNGAQAIDMVEQHDPHVVLMDIRMPGMDGLEAAQHLSRRDNPPAIIFTTAYNEYALSAFDTHAVGYLLKPVRKEKLAEALQKAHRLTRLQLQNLEQEDSPPSHTHISARLHGGIRLIPVEDVLYFQAEHKYVTVVYRDGHVLIEDSLKQLEQRFAELFVRIHRNALVARSQFRAVRRNQQGQYIVELKDSDDKLEVSRRHAAQVKEFLKNLD